jgi:hypothetical protein
MSSRALGVPRNITPKQIVHCCCRILQEHFDYPYLYKT